MKSTAKNKDSKMPDREYKVVVIGVSAGGLEALSYLLPKLPKRFPCPIVVVQHLYPQSGTFLSESLNEKCELQVKEAEEKEPIRQGHIYIAPPDYHLLIERDKTFSLSIDERVNYSRPSIDVLFESAAYALGEKVICIVLTGANADGANGMKLIKKRGGVTIVQDPATAEQSAMPNAAIATGAADFILPLEAIPAKLIALTKTVNKASHKT